MPINTAIMPHGICSYIIIVRFQPVMLQFFTNCAVLQCFYILRNCNAQNCAHEKTCVVHASCFTYHIGKITVSQKF